MSQIRKTHRVYFYLGSEKVPNPIELTAVSIDDAIRQVKQMMREEYILLDIKAREHVLGYVTRAISRFEVVEIKSLEIDDEMIEDVVSRPAHESIP